MRSGSSELLLEQQQQELRNRKLKELAPKKKNDTKQKKTWRERINFYTTSTLAFFTVTAGASLLFLVPLYVDPALSTLASNFIEKPILCRTSRVENLLGFMNCTWTSCREGCTADMYSCMHIYVSFIETFNFTNIANLTSVMLTNLTSEFEVSGEEAILLVNIKGCGYEPCKNFSEMYAYEGAVFPCYYSQQNKTVVLTFYDRDDQISMIINFFVIPFIVTVISAIALCLMHCDCRCKKERSHRRRPPPPRRRPQLENLSDSSISTRVDMLTPAIEVYKPPL